MGANAKRERLQRGTLQVREVGDFWAVELNLGAWVEVLESCDTREEAEEWIVRRCSEAF